MYASNSPGTVPSATALAGKLTSSTMMNPIPAAAIHEVAIPDTSLGRAVTEFVRDTETDLLFNHSSRVVYFGALAGRDRGLKFDAELLYAGAMFHDVDLMPGHSSAHERFEVDGANAAKAFLENHGIAQADVDTLWAAIALHTTPGIPRHMHPVIALVTAGVEMPDVALRSSPNLLTGLRRGICRTCPACGQGRLFGGYLAVLPVCAVCGNDNEQYPSDDFAPYVTIFLVLHLMVQFLFLADRTWAMSASFEVGLAIPIFLLATLALLPFVKGA